MFLFIILHLNSSPSFLFPRMRRRFSAVQPPPPPPPPTPNRYSQVARAPAYTCNHNLAQVEQYTYIIIIII